MAKPNYNEWPKERLVTEVEKLRKRKKYGLVWETKPEDVAERYKIELPVLKEIKNKEIRKDKNGPTNILIQGDNYHALSVLNYTHKGKIDVIYIDPPYNTGAKDWKYNNSFVDINDAYRHSKWLSMMNNRLVLAKKLLKKSGVLIIAIDDNEVHRLRLLIDELMVGYSTTSITLVHNPRGNITNNFARTHEYALFIIPNGTRVIARTKKENTIPRKLRRWGHNSTRKARPTMFYPIYVKNGKIVRVGEVPEPSFHPKTKNIKKKDGEIEIWPIDQDGVERRWNFSLDRINDELGRMITIEKDGEFDIFVTQEDTTPKTVWTETKLEAGRHGATLVRTITKVDFPFPKSLYTVKRCLELVIGNRKDAIVLDFFAGSGTTGHATLELNQEDGGKRNFILCTNNENDIATKVCYPRIANVIKGYKDQGGSKVAGIKGNLKYFQTEFVGAEPNDKNKEALTRQATEMLCLGEDTFEPIKDSGEIKIFRNLKKYTAILFNEKDILTLKKDISKLGGSWSVYIFSLGDDTFEDEFEDVKENVRVAPIPEAILRVYRRIFKS